MTWKDFSGRKEVTLTGSAFPYYGGSGVRWDANASYQESFGSTGHGQPSIFDTQKGMEI